MNALAQINQSTAKPAHLKLVTELPAISVVGLGYVGAVSVACLSSLGHRVVGCDIDPVKRAAVGSGQSPIHEAGLSDLLGEGVDNELIETTGDLIAAVVDTDVTFVSVGTPTKEGGGCDYSAIVSCALAIGEALALKDEHHIIVMRCSIPPGTTLNVMVPAIEAASGKKMGQDFGVCFNPEFLREGTAIEDFRAPPKTVIGASDDYTARVVAKIYAPVDEKPLLTAIEAAEMVKYADNVWHATKVCFANEIGRICKPLDIDSHDVMDIFVQDQKLNLSPYYLKPGFAYGGSCLPKEVRAVAHLAGELDVDVPLIDSLARSNETQISEAIDMVRASGAKRVGFLGLAFKRGTDDLRESPILEVLSQLLEDGYDICAHDEAITAETRIGDQFAYVANVCPHLKPTVDALPGMLSTDVEDVLENSDVVVVTHASQHYRELLRDCPGDVKVIDLVRLFKDLPRQPGYQGIGW
ncbi:MAG: UDP-glucose/GDP-mannose dehydrogenase family protein [Anderseniella sp.]|nr:UDP-glucose/GDP-mannose dehydrogenase family protein [Anderseniella sp.]